jgi:hypothetical protein
LAIRGRSSAAALFVACSAVVPALVGKDYRPLGLDLGRSWARVLLTLGTEGAGHGEVVVAVCPGYASPLRLVILLHSSLPLQLIDIRLRLCPGVVIGRSFLLLLLRLGFLVLLGCLHRGQSCLEGAVFGLQASFGGSKLRGLSSDECALKRRHALRLDCCVGLVARRVCRFRLGRFGLLLRHGGPFAPLVCLPCCGYQPEHGRIMLVYM